MEAALEAWGENQAVLEAAEGHRAYLVVLVLASGEVRYPSTPEAVEVLCRIGSYVPRCAALLFEPP